MNTLKSSQVYISKKLQEEIEMSEKIKTHLKLMGSNCQTLAKELKSQLIESLKVQEMYKHQLMIHNHSDTMDKALTKVHTTRELINENLIHCRNIANRLKKSLQQNLTSQERLECFQKRRRLKQLSIFLKEILNKNSKFPNSISIPKLPVNNYSNKVSIRIIGCDELIRAFSFEHIIASFPKILKKSISNETLIDNANNTNALVKCDLIVNNHILFTTEARRPFHHCWNQTFEFVHDYGNVLEINITWLSPYRSLNSLIKNTASHYRELDFMLAGFTYLVFDEGDRGLISRVIDLYPGGKIFLETIIKAECKKKINGKSTIRKSTSSNSYQPLVVNSHKPKAFCLLTDLRLLALLGTGKFGKIILCQNKSSKQLYALKAQKKYQIIQNNDYSTILEEKKVLQIITKCNHPFLVHLFACLQDQKYVMFLIEFVEAGDLATLIYKLKFFTEKQTKFYSSIVVLCLEFLHDSNIMYRDLKMENLLIDKLGYLKLVDFGLSKTNMKQDSVTSTFCGTIDYIAPELLVDNGYSRMIDWWALGILIYFMTTGKVPFGADTEQESLNAIITRPISLPHKTDKSLSSVILSLLDRNPFSRLGSQNGSADIKNHHYFKNVNFDKIYNKQVVSPFVPNLEHPLDLSYFDEEFIMKRPTLDSAESVESCDGNSFFDDFCL